MRHIAYALALAGSLAMGSCSTVESVEQNLASPTTTQALSNVRGFTQAFACGLSTAAAAAQGVEAQTYSGQPLVNNKGQQITAIVYAASATTCTLLGGVLTSPKAVPVSPDTTVVATTKAN